MSAQSAAASPWACLDERLLLCIWGRCSFRDIGAIALVCRRWYHLVFRDSFRLDEIVADARGSLAADFGLYIPWSELVAVLPRRNPLRMSLHYLNESALQLQEYKRYLYVQQQHPPKSAGRGRAWLDHYPPGPVVDAVWHKHLADSKRYARDMVQIFRGVYVHGPMPPSWPQKKQTKLKKRYRRLYEEVFQERPLTEEDVTRGTRLDLSYLEI